MERRIAWVLINLKQLEVSEISPHRIPTILTVVEHFYLVDEKIT